MQNKNEDLFQFIKFGLVGVLNTGVDWVVFYLLIHFALEGSETIAKALAFLVAMLNSYLLNTIWTFKKEYQSSTASSGNSKSIIFGKFMAVSLVGWGINVLVFSQALRSLDIALLSNKELLPLVFASGAAIVWNFFANKLWTYKN